MKYLPYVFLIFILSILVIVSVIPDKNQGSADGYQQYLIVNYPWKSHENTINIILESHGLLVEEGAFSFLLITASNNANFIKNAYMNGAFLVLDPIVKGSCYRQSKNKMVSDNHV